MKKRAHVFIEGRVQGVCFRSETKAQAEILQLKGWVKNLYDGRVEAVFEGEEDSVNKMLHWCRKGPPYAVVNNVEIQEEEFTGEFKAFRVEF